MGTQFVDAQSADKLGFEFAYLTSRFCDVLLPKNGDPKTRNEIEGLLARIADNISRQTVHNMGCTGDDHK